MSPRMTIRGLTLLAATVSLAGAVGAQGAAARPHAARARLESTHDRVVVQRGQPVQIAFTADTTDLPDFTQSFEQAIRMAISRQPRIKGFPVRVNVVQTRCGQDPSVDADDAAAAQTIVANTQNTAVLGNLCSFGFASALAVYQAADVVAISGSATSDALPAPGLTVFDRMAVADGDGFLDWYNRVQSLPSDLAWQDDYAAEFGSAPQPYADLWFDAARLLLRRLGQVSSVDGGGRLVIPRAALASAVRHTTAFHGVSCTVTLDAATGNRVNDPAALSACAGG